MFPLRGKTIADSYNSNIKLYKSLGSLIHDYRQYYKLSQEKISELIGISVRELRNWETDRCRARIENLHDFSEVTGIPMQVCVALNADQPIWYSLQERRFAYSSMEAQSYSHELYKFSEQLGDRFIVRAEKISKDKHVSMIVSYHREIYHTVKPLRKDVVETAASILPDLNHIIFDSWGHYVGHVIFLPLRSDVYKKLKMQKNFESYLSRESINDIVALGEGVFLNYSSYAASINASHQNIVSIVRYLAKIKQKGRYMVAGYSPVEETCKLYNKIGMSVARDYQITSSEIYCKLYEIELDALIRPKQPLWNLLCMIKQHDNEAFPNNLVKKVKQNLPMDVMTQESDNKSNEIENYSISYYGPSTVDGPLTVDKYFSTEVKQHDPQKVETKAYNLKIESCPNPKCTLYGETEKDNIVSNGTYRKKKEMGFRFLCKKCGKSFCSTTRTIFHNLRSPEERVLTALKLLVKGRSLREVAKAIGVKRDTVQHWLKLAAEQSGKLEAMLIKEANVSQVELDTLWSFVKKNALRQRAILWRRKKTFHGKDW